MNSTKKIAGLLARTCFALLVIIIASTLLILGRSNSAKSAVVTQELSQSKERIIRTKPWPVEPVKVVAAKNKKKANIEIAQPFDDDEDWLDGFTVTVINNSGKIVTAMNVELTFRREPGDTRVPVGQPLHFGPSPIVPAYVNRDRTKVIKIGKTAELKLNPEDYESMKDRLNRHGYSSIRQVDIVVREVGFEDGSVLLSGTYYLQDPANPTILRRKFGSLSRRACAISGARF
jgi:hypothetical protein